MSWPRWSRMAILTIAAMLVGASISSASTTRYFYDAYGRYIGLTTTGTQIRSNTYDNADNRQYYQLLGPNSPTSTQELAINQSIFQGQTLTSGSGAYTFTLQEDGNVVLYHGASGLWQTSTSLTTGATLLMQSDGNLCLYDAQWISLWCSNTSGNPGAKLTVQSDGNAVIYSTGGVGLWATNTAGR